MTTMMSCHVMRSDSSGQAVHTLPQQALSTLQVLQATGYRYYRYYRHSQWHSAPCTHTHTDIYTDTHTQVHTQTHTS